MNAYVHKNRATSRYSRDFYWQCRDVTERLDFQFATFSRGIISMSRHCREVLFQHCDVGIQRRNIVEVYFQRRNVGIQRHDAAERYIFQRCDVESNIATFPRPTTRKFLQKSF